MRGVSAGLSNEADKKDRYQPNCSRCLIWSGEISFINTLKTTVCFSGLSVDIRHGMKCGCEEGSFNNSSICSPVCVKSVGSSSCATTTKQFDWEILHHAEHQIDL